MAQIVIGVRDQVSTHLFKAPITRKLSFTASVPAGKQLLKLTAETVMRSTMELGGHGLVLFFDDCDPDKTIKAMVGQKFRNAGQVSVAPTRFFVQATIYDPFAEGFAQRAGALILGDGTLASTQMGPLANPRRPDAIESLVADVVAQGDLLMAGGSRGEGHGFFHKPPCSRTFQIPPVPCRTSLSGPGPHAPVLHDQRCGGTGKPHASRAC